MENVTNQYSLFPASPPHKQKGGYSFPSFCSSFMSHAFYADFAEYQEEIVKIVDTRKVTKRNVDKLKPYIFEEYHKYLKPITRLNGILDIEPRNHGKTTRMCQAYPLYVSLEKRNVYALIISSGRDSSEEIMDAIKSEIELNDDIIEAYGDQCGTIWRSKKIVLKNNNTLASVGIGGSMRGTKGKNYMRVSHVFMDDLMKDEHIENRTQRDKLYRKIKRVILNLGKDIFVFIVNTIMHNDDIPNRFLKEIECGNFEDWIALRFDCYRPNGNPLWPSMWSLHDLEKKKKEIGSHAFATEWRNKPLPDEDRKFKKDQFKYFELHDVDFSKLQRVMAVDPATGKDIGDFSGITITCKDTNFYYTLYAEGKKIGDIELINWIIDLFRVWKPHVILFEENVFQEIYKNQVIREGTNRGIALPIRGVKHFTTNNQFRVSKLSPLVESGILRFMNGQDLLFQELEEFPQGYDDIATALEMCISHHGDISSGKIIYESVQKSNFKRGQGTW